MDKIIRGYLEDFAQDFGFDGNDIATLFEHFVNYCVVAPELTGPPDLQSIHVAGTDDTGLDGIALIVNDHLLTSKEQFDDLRRQRGRLEVSFIFTQAKSGPKFDSGEIGNFLFGVREFFDSHAKLPANDGIRLQRELVAHVFNASIDFRRNPECLLCYATTGEWLDDHRLRARVEQEVSLLKKTNLFSNVEFRPLDGGKLKALYKNLKRRLVQEIEFERHAILPRLDKVSVAYIGILPVKEYLKLVTGLDGRINKSIFYENIRDFQGDTPVNNEIRDTLEDKTSQSLLPILNNGVTIVARSVDPTGTTFRLTDYQIVNGCQTSHAIFAARDKLDPTVSIPIKLIATSDSDVTNRIIRATNRQTEIKPEAFVALLPFHKELEDLYASMARSATHPLYYERRSRQYDGSSVKSHQIVTLAAQVANFTAIFLEEPHSCHRYYGELIAAYRDRLFKDNHTVLPYYLSSFLLYRLDGMFRQNWIAPYLRAFRYHIALLVRVRFGGSSMPGLESKKMNRYCEGIIDMLQDNKRSAKIFEEAAERVKQEMQVAGDRASAHVRAFTQELLK